MILIYRYMDLIIWVLLNCPYDMAIILWQYDMGHIIWDLSYVTYDTSTDWNNVRTWVNS